MPKARVGGEHERGVSPSCKGGSGNLFKSTMSVEANLMHFETMLACESLLNMQAFHVAFRTPPQKNERDSYVNRGIPLTDAICKRAILSTSFSSWPSLFQYICMVHFFN